MCVCVCVCVCVILHHLNWTLPALLQHIKAVLLCSVAALHKNNSVGSEHSSQDHRSHSLLLSLERERLPTTISTQNERRRAHAVQIGRAHVWTLVGGAVRAAGRHPRISVQVRGRDDPIPRRRSEGHQGGRLWLWGAVGYVLGF